jgi:hypothetical protein
MRVLLKEGAAGATSQSILVLPQASGSTLETLAGDAEAKGLVAEVDERAVVSAVNAAADSRRDEFVAAKDLMGDLKWLHKAIGAYEAGSKIGLTPSPKGFTLDDSEAIRTDRAAGLAEGDTIAVGPDIRPKTYLNARGKVVSIKGDKVEVELDPGDRDRLERATAKPIAKRIKLPRVGVEKVS